MRPALCIIITAFVVATQAQTETQQTVPLTVVKFSAGIYREPSKVVSSVLEPDQPMEPIRSTPVIPRNETAVEKARREMNEQRIALRRVEINAANSANKGDKLYLYHLEVKNTGTRKIKSFAWEYRSSGVSDPSDRQFYCAVNAKPNDKKEFDLLAPFAPSRVVDATSAGQKTDKKGVVVINKVEYAEGPSWVRPGWKQATFSDEVTKKVEIGQCVGL
ncbi:MAG TPA: hypothetical protein VFX97_10610 [Pyrinomonadaceae bacterium]|nr:hypothetical protein [Pyrinomonadaceae bacterium]